MSDELAARLRTWWPILLGHVAAVLVVWAQPALVKLEPLGVHVGEAVLFEVIGFVLAGAVWELGRWLERWPDTRRGAGFAHRAARVLLSLGVSTGQPQYNPTTPPTRR
jgi:hypothetical protein